MTEARSATTGMRAFLIVWAGQLVSILGTSLTGFGLQVWVYLETGSVTRLALVTLAYALPGVLLAPVAGALVDRWDRRVTMLVSDLAAGFTTMGIALLFFTDTLEIWHVYALVGVGAMGNTFQGPAWMASVSLLVPKKQLGRANGLVQVAEAVAMISAPAIAGALLATVGLGAVLLADVATFLVAVATLAIVRFPRPERAAEDAGESVWDDVRIGWRYLRQRVGLVWLLGMYAGVNFVLSFANVLVIPLVVSFSSESVTGTVFSIAGIGMLIGSVLVSVWGGPKQRVRGIVLGIVVGGASVVMTGIRPSLVLIGIGFFLLMLGVPVVQAASQVIWQLKVAPAVQGRVFALRRMIASGVSPIAILAAGPLADGVFEPLMADDGALAGTVGAVLGTGAGRGIGLMVVLSGIGMALMALAGWLHPRVRNLEAELPDMIPDDEPEEAPGVTAPPVSGPVGAGP